MDYDANSPYPFAMWDENSVYPKIENGFIIKPDMIDVYVEAFTKQTFNQHGVESAILGINYYNPPNLIFQHLPVKGKVKKIEVNRMRNGYIIDTLTSIDICEIVEIDGKVIEINEAVFFVETLRYHHLQKV